MKKWHICNIKNKLLFPFIKHDKYMDLSFYDNISV